MTKIKTSHLKNALEIVKPGLANKEIIEQSTHFAFMNGRVCTYNDEISISSPVPGFDATGAVWAEELYQLLSKTKKDEIEMVITDTEVQLKSGRGKASLILKQEIKLPLEEVGKINDWEPLPKDFLQFLPFAIHACSNDMSQPLLTCVHVKENGVIEASDRFRIAKCQLFDEMPTDNFLLPATSAAQVIRLKPTHIAKGEGWIHFKAEEKDAIISCRIFNDKFPDMTPHLKVTGNKITFPKTMRDMIDRATVFSKRDHFLDERITIALTEKRITVKSESDTGKYEEPANMKYAGKDFAFSITPYLLKEILGRTQNCIVGKDRLKFEDEGWEYICMLRAD